MTDLQGGWEGWNVPDAEFGLALRPRGSTGEARRGALESMLAAG